MESIRNNQMKILEIQDVVTEKIFNGSITIFYRAEERIS